MDNDYLLLQDAAEPLNPWADARDAAGPRQGGERENGGAGGLSL